MRVFSQINKCQQKKNNKKQKGGGGAPLLDLAKSICYLIVCVFHTSSSPWHIGKLTSGQVRADTEIYNLCSESTKI